MNHAPLHVTVRKLGGHVDSIAAAGGRYPRGRCDVRCDSSCTMCDNICEVQDVTARADVVECISWHV
jgi:hypothetical protein